MAVVRCEVWWAQPIRDAASVLDRLDDAERRRCGDLRFDVDRVRFVSGRLLARHAIAVQLGVAASAIGLLTRCPTCGGPHGKPVVTGEAARAGIDFSISHAGDRVVVATTRGAAVGVDVERVRPAGGLAGPHGGALAADERSVLAALASDQRDGAFMRYWTRKEAVLKATGEGLATQPDLLSVTAPDEPPAVTAWPPGRPARQVQLADLDAGPDYRACVAVLTASALELTQTRLRSDDWDDHAVTRR